MAVRNADNILIGGYRVFVVDGEDKHELGWTSGEVRVEEQGNTHTVKESEGGTVLTLTTDKEVHLTFGLLECNPETLIMLNPSAVEIGGTGDTESDGKGFAVGTFQSDKTFQVELWHKKRSGKYLCARIYKGKVSGNITSLQINQDNESPISIDIVGQADDTRPTNHNIYEEFECEAAKAPGGGW